MAPLKKISWGRPPDSFDMKGVYSISSTISRYDARTYKFYPLCTHMIIIQDYLSHYVSVKLRSEMITTHYLKINNNKCIYELYNVLYFEAMQFHLYIFSTLLQAEGSWASCSIELARASTELFKNWMSTTTFNTGFYLCFVALF